MALAWDRFDKANGKVFDLSDSREPEPKEAFLACIENHGLPPPPFSNKHQIWTASREALLEFGRLIDNYIERNPEDNLVIAWEGLFMKAITRGDDDDNYDEEQQQAFSMEMASKLRKTGMQLARTPPGIFGGSFKENGNQTATLHLEPFDDDNCEESTKGHRHDMVMWVAASRVFGNASSYLSAESLLAQDDPSQPAMKVSNGQGETFIISKDAKDAMAVSVESMANRPTIYFLCLYVMTAVTKILGVDLLQYSMPQTEEELRNFNWKDVDWNNLDTFPKARDPTALDFEKVRTVHEMVKAEKDAQARACGGERSSVQTYGSYRARWKQWRDYFAVYRWMYSTFDLGVTYAALMGDLKMCRSKNHIECTIKAAVKKHIDKLRREMYKQSRKDKLEQEKAAAVAAEAEAQAQAEEAAAKQAQLRTERQLITNSKIYEGTRHQQKVKRQAELEAKRAEERETAKRIQEAADRAKAKKREQAEIEKQKDKVDESSNEEEGAQTPKKKRAKRNDVTHLNGQSTPRQKMDVNPSWKPPTRAKVGSSLKFEEPGDAWVNESTKKLALLFSLRNHLQAKQMLDLPMTFYNIMDFIGADSLGLEFNERVFLYLLALILGQGRYVVDRSFP
jgi:hypothetical protein